MQENNSYNAREFICDTNRNVLLTFRQNIDGTSFIAVTTKNHPGSNKNTVCFTAIKDAEEIFFEFKDPMAVLDMHAYKETITMACDLYKSNHFSIVETDTANIADYRFKKAMTELGHTYRTIPTQERRFVVQ
jgi:hypothetical protein